jgi:hypothetical protein
MVMNDDKLLKIAVEIDDFLTGLITKHDLDALVTSSIILARLTRMNVEVDGGEEFKALMLRAMGLTIEQSNIH